MIFQVDYGIETTSENPRCQVTGTEWPGADGVGTPATGKFPCYGRYATVRNNLFYYENACGNSIGGYALAKAKGGGGNGGGSSYHDVFVNNTLFDNGDQPGNDSEGTPAATSRFNISWAARKRTISKITLFMNPLPHPIPCPPTCGSIATFPPLRPILPG